MLSKFLDVETSTFEQQLGGIESRLELFDLLGALLAVARTASGLQVLDGAAILLEVEGRGAGGAGEFLGVHWGAPCSRPIRAGCAFFAVLETACQS
jgi:hypothetical protein